MRPGWLLYGKLQRPGELLDEVVLECVGAGACPTFVINCHGGALAARRVLGALRQEGVDLCSWSEFLERSQRLEAFNRIWREAAERLPCAATLLAARVLLDQQAGAFAGVLNSIRGFLGDTPNWAEAQNALERLLATAPFGRGLFEHGRVVLAGRPNVGKSTLANALLRFERVITHRTPGTTRDTVEESLSIRGVPFVLVDTAGLRDTTGDIELEGVRRGTEEVARADVAVAVFDGSVPLQKEDVRLIEQGLPQRTVAVLNKCDLPQAVPVEALSRRLGQAPVLVSASQGLGLKELEQRILNAAYPRRPLSKEAVVFTERQERLVRAALEAAKARDRGKLEDCLRSLTWDA